MSVLVRFDTKKFNSTHYFEAQPTETIADLIPQLEIEQVDENSYFRNSENRSLDINERISTFKNMFEETPDGTKFFAIKVICSSDLNKKEMTDTLIYLNKKFYTKYSNKNRYFNFEQKDPFHIKLLKQNDSNDNEPLKQTNKQEYFTEEDFNSEYKALSGDNKAKADRLCAKGYHIQMVLQFLKACDFDENRAEQLLKTS